MARARLGAHVVHDAEDSEGGEVDGCGRQLRASHFVSGSRRVQSDACMPLRQVEAITWTQTAISTQMAHNSNQTAIICHAI